ncbi:MAG: hypothetical protein GY950_21235, partial [bacterium]|nr:hypothetical protein [bacterium]
QDSRVIGLLVGTDLVFHRVWRRLKAVFNMRLFFTRVRLVVNKLKRMASASTSSKEKEETSAAEKAPRQVEPAKQEDTSAVTYRIVTVGGYGYNDVGDEAMPRAIIANLKEQFGNRLGVTMLSPYPDFTVAYHGNFSSRDIIFNYNADDIAGLNFERDRYLKWAAIYAKNKIRAFFLIFANFRAPFFKLLRIIDKSNALLNVGGGNINSIMRKELYKRTTVHLIAKTLGKKVYISGQTIGPFYNDNDRCIALESVNAVDILTFRDRKTSARRVAAIGIDRPMMYDAGDDAFTLKSIGKEAAAKLIAADSDPRWFDLKCKQTWALNLKASLKMFKGAGRSSDLSVEIRQLVKIAEYILNRYDSRILLVSTDYCEGVDDRVVLKEVYDAVADPLKSKINLLNDVYTDHELKGIISFCDFALGARYHFSVFSLAASVPTIGLASGEYQRTKLKGVLELLDLSGYYIPEDMEYASIEKVTQTIDKMVTEGAAIRETLARSAPLLAKESKKIVDFIYRDLMSRKK